MIISLHTAAAVVWVRFLFGVFEYTVAARYLDNSEEMVRERYSHIMAGELSNVATEALDQIDGSIYS